MLFPLDEVNVLLVGENDGRHILDIMSRAKYKANQSVNVSFEFLRL